MGPGARGWELAPLLSVCTPPSLPPWKGGSRLCLSVMPLVPTGAQGGGLDGGLELPHCSALCLSELQFPHLASGDVNISQWKPLGTKPGELYYFI